MSLASLTKKINYTFVSLTQTESSISKLIKPSVYIPAEFVPRLAYGGDISLEEAAVLIQNVPTLEPETWAEYWLEAGQSYEKVDHPRAACMCYLLGSFPKDGLAVREEAFELQKRTFKDWTELHGHAIQELFLDTPLGRMRLYTHGPQDQSQPLPLILFMNGLEGSAEEVCFAIEKFLQLKANFAMMSIPGGWDYQGPMPISSEDYVSSVLNHFSAQPSFDPHVVGMLGFSFGAYWTFISTKLDPRITFAVCNGIPLKYTFRPTFGFGLNPLISKDLLSVLGVKNHLALGLRMSQLSRKASEVYYQESGPILAINGEGDQIVDPRDTELLGSLPGNSLHILPHGGHCGITQYPKMVNHLMTWVMRQVSERSENP